MTLKKGQRVIFFYRPVYEIFELTELQYKDSERENFESANVIAGNEREKVVHIGEIPPGLYYIKIVSVNYSNVDYCFSVN